MPGTALENGSAPVSPVSNGTPERRCESYSVHSPNGLRKGFLNGACSAPVVQDVLDLPEAKPVEHVPLFSQAAAPSHVTNSTTSITLRWKEISQIGLTHPLPEGTQQQTCVVEYAMEKQQVKSFSRQLLC